MSSVFRLSSARFAVNSGIGAALYGGRWNSIGTEVIYAAQSPSLAALEVLVHFSVLPRDFVMTEIRIPDNATILRLDTAELPPGWDGEVPIPETQAIGDDWVRKGIQGILSVQSSIVAPERNFILNPAHPVFESLEFYLRRLSVSTPG